MIHYKLFQDSTKDFRAYVSFVDMRLRGLYLPTYQTIDMTESVGPEDMRSEADVLSNSSHKFAGDTNCINIQVEANLVPLASQSSRVSFMGLPTFDSDTAAYLAARQAGTTKVMGVDGECYYSTSGDVAFVPIQSKFVTTSVQSTPYSGYTYVDKRTTVYSWVPFGNHFAVIITKYFVTTYLPKYPQNSTATVKVKYVYTDIGPTGTVVTHNSVETTVASASGSLSAIAAIAGMADMKTSDPTNWASDALLLITPISGVPAQKVLVDQVSYDPKAASDYYRAIARLRLSNAGHLASKNSTWTIPTDDEWADLADTAIDSCKFTDINSIAYARDLRSFGSELKSVLTLMANPTNPKKWASLYLGLRYGSRLTVSDTNELIRGIKRCAAEASSSWNKNFQTVRSRTTLPLANLPRATFQSRVANYKVYYRPADNVLRKGLKSLTDWDIFPTTQNLWDLVPFSFVVDWVVNVESVCEQLDRRAYEEYIDILGCTYSYKDEYIIPVELSDLGFEDTDVVVTVYYRHHSPTIHQSALRLTAGHLSSINVIDGFSLLLQGNRKR